MSLRFAANLSFMFTELPFEWRFKAAAEAGFTGVEFLFPYDHSPEEIARWLSEAGLTLALHNLPPGDWAAGARGLAALPDRQVEFRASVQTALRYAKATGVRQLHVMAGVAEGRAARETYLSNLAFAARSFAGHDLTALIEPINQGDMPGYHLSSFEEACAILSDIGSPNLRLQFDCYHAQIITGDALATLRTCLPHVAHIQIASVPDRHEPDHGTCDYGAIFALLEQAGYRGWIGCEYHPQGATLDGLDWFRSQSG